MLLAYLRLMEYDMFLGWMTHLNFSKFQMINWILIIRIDKYILLMVSSVSQFTEFFYYLWLEKFEFT